MILYSIVRYNEISKVAMKYVKSVSQEKDSNFEDKFNNF